MTSAKVLPVALLIVGAGVGFIGGYQYREVSFKKNVMTFRGPGGAGSPNFQRFTDRTAGGSPVQGGGLRGAVVGSVLSADDKSVTVKLNDGTSKIVFLTEGTTYTNSTKALQTDLKSGTEVAIFGAPNQDGSITATSVQLNPMFLRMMSPLPSPN